MATSRPLTGWDLATWRLAEADPALRSTMIGVIEVDQPLDLTVVLMRAAAATALQSRLRTSLRLEGADPVLVVLPEVDVRSRIKLLPPDADLGRAVIAAIRQPFPLAEPLWRLRLLQRDGRTWIIGAMHHAIADGGGALSFMSMLLDGVAERFEQVPSTGSGEAVDPTAAVQKLLLRALSDPVGAVGDSVRLLRSAWEIVDAGGGPLNELVADRGDDFAIGWLEVDLDGVPRDQRRGLHHLLVAAAAAAIGRAAQAKPGDVVTVNVPVATAGAGHNQVVVARIGIEIGTPAEMAARSRDALGQWRAQPAVQFAGQLAELAGALPTEMVAANIKRADLTVSTMPPTPSRIAIDGNRVAAVLPMAPPIGAAASLTTLPFGDRLLIGTSFDLAALPADWPALLQSAVREVLHSECDLLSPGR